MAPRCYSQLRSAPRNQEADLLGRGKAWERKMTRPNYDVPRRTVIKAAGLGLAGLATTSAQTATAEPSEAGEIWSSEYWAKKGDVPLWLYRKRLGAPKPGESAPAV